MKMAGNLILNTNVAIALINREQKAKDCIKGYDGIYITSIVLGELYFGAMRSAKMMDNLKRIQRLIADLDTLDVNSGTSLVYGQLKEWLAVAGTPIPENDIWIAALARQHEADIATPDKHSSFVDGLTIIRVEL